MKQYRQPKISRAFQKRREQIVEDEDLENEISELEKELRDVEDYLFELQRDSLKSSLSVKSKRSNHFVKPERLMCATRLETVQKQREMMSLLTGMEVDSYVQNSHCAIVYHLQNPSLQHGLYIDMSGEKPSVSRTSFPLGLELEALTQPFDNVMSSECLASVRRALVAYYDRKHQIHQLKEGMSPGVEVCADWACACVELALPVCLLQGDPGEPEEHPAPHYLELKLEYRPADIRPKHFHLADADLSEEAVEVVTRACGAFSKKPLLVAFGAAFLAGGAVRLYTPPSAPAPAPAPTPRHRQERGADRARQRERQRQRRSAGGPGRKGRVGRGRERGRGRGHESDSSGGGDDFVRQLVQRTRSRRRRR